MKLGTSYFNSTVFRKNMTRFAPAWGLYTLCMLMGLMLILDYDIGWMPRHMAECIQIMSVITPCYALLTVQLLFGDLYSARMCNALHAMPIRREGWFITNVASGIVFHIIPTVVMATIATVLMALGSYSGGWVTGPLWLLCVNLQYICFFGIGVFSAFCVGSRFAMAVVYGILNFGSLIAGWLANTLYEPMLYGVRLPSEPFYWFSPVGYLVSNPVADVELQAKYIESSRGTGQQILSGELTLLAGWDYLWLCAGVGIVLAVLGLALYRQRRLECAGDFMAVKNLEPVFLVVYTLCVGAVLQFVMDDMFGTGEGMVFLFIGLAVGYFTGQMLLQRTVRVFRLREFIKCGGIILVMGATLVLSALDVFGIVKWVPEMSRVEEVVLMEGTSSYHECEITLTEPEDVEKVIAMHREALERVYRVGVGPTVEVIELVETMPNPAGTGEETVEEVSFAVPVTIEYRLTDGRTVTRYYSILSKDKGMEDLRDYFSRIECVFGVDTNLEGLKGLYENGHLSTYYGDRDEEYTFTDENLEKLLEAMVLDCEAGTMIRDWDFHRSDTHIGYLCLYDGEEQLQMDLFASNVHVLQWLREMGIDVDEILKR